MRRWKHLALFSKIHFSFTAVAVGKKVRSALLIIHDADTDPVETLSAHLHTEFFSHILSQQTFCTLPVFLPALDCVVYSLQVPADACARAPLLSGLLSEPACGKQV